jgi:hypothetical protein
MKANTAQTGSTVDRAALIGVTVVGMAMCSGGVGKVATSGQWLSLPGALGSLLGVALLGLVGARLLGRDLPLGRSDRVAIGVVVGVAMAKLAVGALFLPAI